MSALQAVEDAVFKEISSWTCFEPLRAGAHRELAAILAPIALKTVREMDGCPICNGDCGSANPPMIHLKFCTACGTEKS
jgi:hypothetical protein